LEIFYSQIGDHHKNGLARSGYNPYTKYKSLVIPIILVTYSKAKYRNFAIIKIFFSSLLAIRGGKNGPKTTSFSIC
jgi:hypothetical protein